MKRNLIMNFHVIDDPIWFESVIELLQSKYTFVDLSFFEELNGSKKGGYCHLTFDDGDKSFYANAFPILKKYNVPASIYVSPKVMVEQSNFWFQEIEGYDQDTMISILANNLSMPLEIIKGIPFLGILKGLPLQKIHEVITIYQEATRTLPKPCQNMNLDEVLETEKSGLVTIGAHTLNHPILRNESDEDCEKEISGSITQLAELLGHEIRYFAYPNGTPLVDFGEREKECLKKNNIVFAFSTETKYISESDDKLALPRFGLSFGSMRFIKGKLMLGSYWDKLKPLLRYSETKSRKNLALALEKLATRG
jgi:peptidoglycan/xylan/chitin deacetylase (PgdA/CDA1 family)